MKLLVERGGGQITQGESDESAKAMKVRSGVK